MNEEYRAAILNEIQDGISMRFPEFLKTASIWIAQVDEHPVDSSQVAFYLAARCVIEQAYVLTQIKGSELTDRLKR